MTLQQTLGCSFMGLAVPFLGIALLLSAVAVHRATLDYNEEGRYFDAASSVVLHEDAGHAYAFLAGAGWAIGLVLLAGGIWLRRRALRPGSGGDGAKGGDGARPAAPCSLGPSMMQVDATPTQLQEQIGSFLAVRTPARAAHRAREILQTRPEHRIPAFLRQARDLEVWYQEAPAWSLSYAKQAVESAVEKTDREDRAPILLACLAHRSGFVREAVVQALTELPPGECVAPLTFAADDHVSQVRTPAIAHLLCLPVAALASQAIWIAQRAPDAARDEWRDAVKLRLKSAEGQKALLRVALTEESRSAECALDLLTKVGELVPLSELAQARSWRVRRSVGRLAAEGPEMEICALLLQDRRVAVRLAVVQQAAFLASPAREEVVALALTDRSWRVLRVAAAYHRDNEATWHRFSEALGSPRPQDQIRALRVLALVDRVRAKPFLEAALASPLWGIRRAAYEILDQARLLDPEHLLYLQAETQSSVLVPAVRRALQQRGEMGVAARSLLSHRAFVGQPGAATAVAKLPPFEAWPWVLRALAEDWPGAGRAVPGLLQRWSNRWAKGWLRATESQIQAMERSLAEFGSRIPVEGHAVLEVGRRAIEEHRSRVGRPAH